MKVGVLLSMGVFALSLSFNTLGDTPSKWDVEGEQGGTVKRVQFTTDEGSWMNVDVSPDGKSVVFDLLGELYLLPVEGGDAKRLTTTRALEIQPRFSPDGKWISFTSDRNGADNIWIMNIASGETKQVSSESFRLLNNAWWSPDGQYLVARKHFTGRRSLGAGEMWMYSVEGGKGIQLTDKKNQQQDTGEPAFSPDGKFIYFSEDSTPGPTFQYNKNANDEIYQIRQLDMATGEVSNLITGYGGSARPSPSPDGKSIAFIRRVKDQSTLWIYDLESGMQRQVFDDLERDQQEAWAIFGTYPNIAWTPDSKKLMFWANGKITQLDLASNKSKVVPFKAEVDLSIVSAVRAEEKIARNAFDSKMLRDAVTSPDGKTLVVHAAGYLYKVDAVTGKAVRLTNSKNFEYEPSFSPDGKRVIYVSWDDDDLATVQSVKLNGRGVKALTKTKGYYGHPRYSLDGEYIVYERKTGNDLLGHVWSTKPGIYVATANGRDHKLVTKHGRKPQFDRTGEFIFVFDGWGMDKTLERVAIKDGRSHTVFDLKYVSAIELNPASNRIAFSELFDAYVTALPPIGKSIELSAKMTGLPVVKVADTSGASMHWSMDGKTLHWMQGPSYFSAAIGRLDEPAGEVKKQAIKVTLPVAAPSRRYALVNARVITGREDEVLEGGAIIVNGHRIEAVLADSTSVPKQLELIDMAGKTIIPGLVDAHAHAAHFYQGVSPRNNWAYLANLAYGVTTIHDPSANTEFVFGQAEMVKSGEMMGPRVYSTGSILYGADGSVKVIINSLDDARRHLTRLKEVGAHSVKSYNQPRREQRQQINQAARELGLLVVMEGGSTFYHNLTMILDGATGIEHNIPVAPLYKDMQMLWAASNVGYTPTLVVSYGGLSGEYYWYQHDDVFKADPLRQFVPNDWLDARAMRRQKTPESAYYHIKVSKAANKLRELGVSVQAGGHGQMQGLAMHWEMWNLAQGGMPALEVIRAATSKSAAYLGLDADIGSIEKGKVADLVILNKNPLDDIRNTTELSQIVINGVLHESADLSSEQAGLAAPMVWHKKAGSASEPGSVAAHSHTH